MNYIRTTGEFLLHDIHKLFKCPTYGCEGQVECEEDGELVYWNCPYRHDYGN